MNMGLHEAIEHARRAACDGSVRVMKELLIFFVHTNIRTVVKNEIEIRSLLWLPKAAHELLE